MNREFWHVACNPLRLVRWVGGGGKRAVNRGKRVCAMKRLSRAVTLALIILAGSAEMTGAQPATAVTAEPGKASPAKKQPPAKGAQRAGDRLPLEVQSMLTEFREQQKVQLDEYRKVAQQARDASAEKREVLREQLRQMLADQRAEREKLREQIRERLQELTTELPERREVLDAAREAARDQKERAKGE